MLLRPDFVVYCRLACPQIGITALDEAGTFEDLPEQEKTKIDGDTDVSGDKIGDMPVASRKDFPTVENNDDAEEDERNPSGVGLSERLEWECITRHALSLEMRMESNIGNTN